MNPIPDKNSLSQIEAVNKEIQDRQDEIVQAKTYALQLLKKIDKAKKDTTATLFGRFVKWLMESPHLAFFHKAFLKISSNYSKKADRQLLLQYSITQWQNLYTFAIQIINQDSQLIKELKAQSQQLQKNTLKELEEQRRHSPVTKKALQGQSSAFQAERDAKQAVRSQQAERQKDASTKAAYALPSTKNAVAYYKEHIADEAQIAMEKFIWDAAVLLGKERFFVPTKLTTLNPGISPRGLVQPKGGERLDLYIGEQGKTISKESLMDGVVTSLAFGMFDANLTDILVDEQGTIKFFDNTRSMPNSNGVINIGSLNVPAMEEMSGIKPGPNITHTSYKCGLQSLQGMDADLTPADRAYLKAEIQSYVEKLDKLEAFMKTSKTLQHMTPGWMPQGQAIAAMRERISRMLTAVDTVTSLQQLVYATIQDYKFFTALTILMAAHRTNEIDKITDAEFQREKRRITGYYLAEELFSLAAMLQIDLFDLKHLCDQPETSLSMIMDRIKLLLEKKDKPSVSQVEIQRRELCGDFHFKANFDAKERSRKNIPMLAFEGVMAMFENQGLKVYAEPLTRPPKGFKPYITADYNKNPATLTYHYFDDRDNPLSEPIDYFTHLGKISIRGKLINPNQLRQGLKDEG